MQRLYVQSFDSAPMASRGQAGFRSDAAKTPQSALGGISAVGSDAARTPQYSVVKEQYNTAAPEGSMFISTRTLLVVKC